MCVSKILVLGAEGFLGNRLFLNSNKSYTLYGTSRNKEVLSNNLLSFDAQSVEALPSLLEKIRPEVVINCIGFTNVDMCESNPIEAFKINTFFPEQLASLTHKLNIRFIHISTDHYKSILRKPRIESTKMWPVNAYGKSKIEAERLILSVNKKALVIRTNFFGYEVGRRNTQLLSRVKSSLDSGVNFFGFNDVFFSPLSVSELIKAIYLLIDLDFSGLVNISGNDSITKLEFAQNVAINLKLPKEKIISSSAKKSNLLTARPQYLSLDNSLYKKTVKSDLGNINDMIKSELLLYKPQ